VFNHLKLKGAYYGEEEKDTHHEEEKGSEEEEVTSRLNKFCVARQLVFLLALVAAFY
jgi:hypothetical protein